MKKLLVLVLALTIVLSLTTMASAVVFSPEIGALYWSRAGNPIAVVAGALINPKSPPMIGARIRAGYGVSGVKGLILLVDGVFTYPTNERVDIYIGGGFNISDRNAASVTFWFGGQVYSGVVFRVTKKAGVFVEAGWINTAQKVNNVYASTNNLGVAFGVRADIGRQ